MISFDEAVELVRQAASPLGRETVSIEDAAGRVLASRVVARIQSPRTDVSAMDGYAVRDADLNTLPARLQVTGKSFAGHGWNEDLTSGECVRIFTGAPVPPGTDRVIIQENVRRDGDTAIVEDKPGTARHIRGQGSDFEVGEELLPSGRLLDPRAVIAAAAADLPNVQVYRRPSVHILSTGDELAEPGTAAAGRYTIPESVSFGIAALATEWGADVLHRLRLPDDLEQMEQVAAQAASRADVVIVTGGASVGEKDFAQAMFEQTELNLIFSKVSIKPGKPVWLGRAGAALVMGLPGNPTSAFVTARLLLAPLIAGLAGRSIDNALRWTSAPLSAPLKACGPRETFHRAWWTGNAVELFAFQDSSAQKVLAASEVLVRQRANSPALAAGSQVKVLAL
jgi:molybdopterin molybdotransferase